MENTKKVFIDAETKKELGLNKNYFTVTEKVKKDPVAIAKAKADKAKRKRDKKKMNKIMEKKQKETELKDIMDQLEQSALQPEQEKVNPWFNYLYNALEYAIPFISHK